MAFNDQQRIKFGVLIAALCETFQKTPTDGTFLGYEMALDDLPIERIEIAVRKAMRTCKFMPAAVELRELTGELSTTDRPRLAWGEFERAVIKHGYGNSPDFEDKLINATIRHLGGWERCCDLESEEFDKWLRKDFEATYATFMRHIPSPELCAPLVGAYEQHNRLHAPEWVEKSQVKIGTKLPPIPGIESRPLVSNTSSDVPRVEFKKP